MRLKPLCVLSAVACFALVSAAAAELPEGPELSSVGVHEGIRVTDAQKDACAKKKQRRKKQNRRKRNRSGRSLRCNLPLPPEAEHPLRGVAVSVTRKGAPLVIALSAYEPVEWQLQIADGADVKAVVLSGYYRQKLTGAPEGIPVVQSSYESGDEDFFYYYTNDSEQPYAMSYVEEQQKWACTDQPLDWYRSTFLQSMEALKRITGLEPVSVQGTYGGAEFSVSDETRGSYLPAERTDGYCYRDLDGVVRVHNSFENE